MKKTIFMATTVALILAACKTAKHSETTATVKSSSKCADINLSYNTDIKPILEKNCVKCHGDEGKGGYNFTDIADIVRAGKNGDLLGTIKWLDGFRRMPAHAEQLDASTIAKIECWVNNGMN